MPTLSPTPRAPAPDRPPTRPQKLPGGLVYVTPAMPGLTRVRNGAKAFRYRQPDGQWLQDPDEITRIQRLAIPPAYSDVWICPLPNGHLQATGLDARGRRQYRYHPQWRKQRDEGKFEHLQAFGRALPRIRSRVARELAAHRSGQPLTRTLVLATLVRLLDTTFLRVGNEEYAATNKSYGLTTLRTRHVQVKGSQLKLRFRGKSGVQQEAELSDPRVVRVVRHCQQLPGQELFQYEDEDGTPRTVGSGDVNDYLREITQGVSSTEGDHFTAKDFRTWHGTTQALELTRLACTQTDASGAADKNVRYSAKAILAEVARQLGNTPAVCKKSYVHPAVLDLGSRLASDAGPGMQEVWNHIGGTTSPRGLSAAERRLLAFLRKPQRQHKAHPSAKA
ncbi:DNA topoisomerase IB [Acidovorax sp. ACV01]|uniref:DNA topoisomerase IB n=1 Tax=Acidovorax sp. ACV01 TaxID=2769311 RepID=UPI001CE06493|nr:DNA topoisomerase IB [Acidovorax sp. ACV01]